MGRGITKTVLQKAGRLSRLGYNIENYEELKNEILSEAGKYPVKLRGKTEYGVETVENPDRIIKDYKNDGTIF